MLGKQPAPAWAERTEGWIDGADGLGEAEEWKTTAASRRLGASAGLTALAQHAAAAGLSPAANSSVPVSLPALAPAFPSRS